jgi:hypothetical protein
MRADERYLVEGTLASWAAHDLETVRLSLHKDAIYRLHLLEGAWPIAGVVRGRQNIIACLNDFLRQFDVLEYRLLRLAAKDGCFATQVKLHYGHKPTGLSYEATVRNKGRLCGDKILYFEVYHDTARLKAFYEMVTRMTVEA